MKSLIKTKRRPSKKEVVMAGAILVLVGIVILMGLALAGSVKSKKGLEAKLKSSDDKVASLQQDLKNIGETLSGLKSGNSASSSQGSNQLVEAAKLKRLSLVATPGETVLSMDVPDGWENVGENRLRKANSTVAAQSEDIDLLTIPNYKVDRVVDSFSLKNGETAFIVFIKSTEANRGYLSLSFCNPETGAACSYRGEDGKYVFILAHGYEDDDQFVRDMDFNTTEGIQLLNDFRVMMKSLELS